jgi:hypothetical protein
LTFLLVAGFAVGALFWFTSSNAVTAAQAGPIEIAVLWSGSVSGSDASAVGTTV